MTAEEPQPVATTGAKESPSFEKSLQDAAAATAAKQRTRASTACNACRLRRSKCLFETLQPDCTPCRRNNIPCVVEHTDGRKRRRQKNDIPLLRKPLATLESMAERRNGSIIHPGPADSGHLSPSVDGLRSGAAGTANFFRHRAVCSSDDYDKTYGQPVSNTPHRSGHIISKTTLRSIIPPDQGCEKPISPRLEPSIASSLDTDRADTSLGHNADVVLKFITKSTDDYLLELFWTIYCRNLCFVDRALFLDAKGDGNPDYYSKTLHCCLLLVGMRFADRERQDMQSMLVAPDQESKLYRVTKRLVEDDLESGRPIPLVQSLLLLGETEAALGRYNAGWMYIGMAFRIALYHGLDLDCNYIGLTPREHQVHQSVLYACIALERFWTLVLRQAPTVKKFDVKLLHCAAELLTPPTTFWQPTSISPFSNELRDVITTGKAMQKLGPSRSGRFERNDYFMAFMLDRELHALYSGLSESARWNPTNVQSANSGSFFIFHQHYHVDLILLHRPFAKFPPFHLMDYYKHDEVSFHTHNENLDRTCQISRMVCFTHAITLTQIFKIHHARLDGRKMLITAVGHAEVAATTLFMCLVHINDTAKRGQVLACLHDLSEILRALSATYTIANKMLRRLNRALKNWKAEMSLAETSAYGIGTPMSRRQSSDNDLPESLEKQPVRRSKTATAGFEDDSALVEFDLEPQQTSNHSNVAVLPDSVLGSCVLSDELGLFPFGTPLTSQCLPSIGDSEDISMDLHPNKDWSPTSPWNLFLNSRNDDHVSAMGRTPDYNYDIDLFNT